MLYATAILSSATVSYFAHHWAEAFLKNRGANIRLVVKGYHVHHSFFGALFLLIGIVFTSSVVAAIMAGYGVGNLWHHKITHNRAQEKGLVFLNKLK